MNPATEWQSKPRWVYALLLGVLAACIWAGWHDFNPAIPQEVVRAGIRSTIRQAVQVGIQFILPAIIIYLLVRDGLASIRQKRTSRDAA